MTTKKDEANAKKNFQKHALGRLLIKLVENQMGQGMADMVGTNRHGTAFWLEAKDLGEWPKRAATLPLRLSFEPGQVPFLKEWTSWNGHAFCLLRAEGEYYLLHPKGQFDLVDMTQSEIKADAVRTGVENIISYLESLT